MPEQGAPRGRIWAALILVYVVWGSTYLGLLLAERTIPTFLMGSLRFSIAGAVLYAWAIRRGDRAGDRPGLRQWAAAAVVGVLLLAVGNMGVAWSEKRVPTGVASLIVATVPLWLALFDRLACGQRLTRLSGAGLVVGFAGAAVLASPTGVDRIDTAAAIVLALGSASWAAGSLYARRAPLPQRPLVSSSMQMLSGGLVLAVVAVARGELGQVHNVSTESLLALAYLIVMGSIVGFSAYAWLLRRARTSLVGTYAYVNPLVAVLLGFGFENEQIGPRTLLAGALILGAVVLIVTPPRTRPGAAAAPAALPVPGEAGA